MKITIRIASTKGYHDTKQVTCDAQYKSIVEMLNIFKSTIDDVTNQQIIFDTPNKKSSHILIIFVKSITTSSKSKSIALFKHAYSAEELMSIIQTHCKVKV